MKTISRAVAKHETRWSRARNFINRLICLSSLSLLTTDALAFRPIITESKGDRILDKQRALHGVDSEIAELRLSSIDSNGNVTTREFVSAFERQGSKTLGIIIFTQPSSIRGTVLVAQNDTAQPNERGPDVHIYLPAVKTVQKITQAMPGQQSFFGSEFTWEDIMLESLSPQKAKWLRGTRLQDRTVDVVELTATNGPNYLRESRHLYIDSQTLNTLRIDVFSRSSELSKTLTAYDYASPEVNGTSKRPHRLVAQNISSMETSVLTLLSAQQNIDIADSHFIPKNLEHLSVAENPIEFLSEDVRESDK